MDENKNNDAEKQPDTPAPDVEAEKSEVTSAPEVPTTSEIETPEQSTDTNTEAETDTTTDSTSPDGGPEEPEEDTDAGTESSDDTPADDDSKTAEDTASEETPWTPETEEKSEEATESSEPQSDQSAIENASESQSSESASPTNEHAEEETPAETTEAASTTSESTVEPADPTVSPSSSEVSSMSDSSEISPAPTVPDDDILPPSMQTPSMPAHQEKKKMGMVLMVTTVVIVIAIIAIAVALVLGNKKKTPTTTATTATTTKAAPKIDTWTGKGNTYDWDTAANWSLGVPVNGESLAFNVSAIKQPSTGTVTLNDNIPSLTVSKIMVDGQGAGFTVSGSPITITAGLASSITPVKSGNSTTIAPVAVQFNNALTFSGDQTVSAAANNDLTFSGSNNATTTIGTSTVEFIAAKSSDIEVSTPLVGTGEIDIPSSSTTTGNVDFNTASPDFSGNVMVSSGATVGMSNQNPSGSGISTTDAFGTAAITIASGAYLEINEVGATSFSIPNNITVGGTGATSASPLNGAYTGAIATCITSQAKGCADGATVTFTGKVNLVSNTEFGAFYGLNAPQTPPNTTVTYSFKNLVLNNHTLTAVADSKAVVVTPKAS